MPRASLKAVFDGLSLGTVPLAYVTRCGELLREVFPHHHLTFVQTGSDAEIFIYPRLTKDEQERWDTAFEELCRDLG